MEFILTNKDFIISTQILGQNQLALLPQIHWRVASVAAPEVNVTDVDPGRGVLEIPPDVTQGEIRLAVLEDEIPELDEDFRVILTRVEGGAEIDSQYSASAFRIR